MQLNVVQPMGLAGEVKLIPALTMKAIGDTLIAQGLASAEEIAAVVAELVRLAGEPGTLLGFPRVVQAWGRRLR